MKLKLAIAAVVAAITFATAQPARAVVTIEYLALGTFLDDSSDVFPDVSVGDIGAGQFRYDPTLLPTQQSNIIAVLIGLLQAKQTVNGIITKAEGPFTLTLMRATEDVMEIRWEGIDGFDFPNESITYRFTAGAGSMLDDSFSLPDPSIFTHRGFLTSAQVEVVLGDSRFVGGLGSFSVVPEPSGIATATLSGLTLLSSRRPRRRNCNSA